MKIILIGLGGLVVLAGAVVLIGMLLPQTHLATSTARFNHRADTVWALVRNLEGYASWWPNVQRVEPVAGRPFEAWRQIDQNNGAIPVEVIEVEPPFRLVTRIIDDGLPFGGTWTYQVAPDGDGARLTITEDGRVYNAIFRFVSRFVMGHHRTMDGYLKALGNHLGVDVIPEHIE